MAKILIIDDDGIVRDALAVFLTRAGHEVSTAADGVNGLLVFRNNPPDLVVLDRDLPGLSGSEVMAGIREAGRETKVIILTGYDNPEDAEEYLRSGAAAFLSKGDGLSHILAEVDRLLGVPCAPAAGPLHGRQASAPHPPAGRIVVADDDDSMRAVLCRFLVSEGYAVFPAADGGAALAAVEKENPDMVLLDIYMPVKDGVVVLRELVAKRPEVGVLMITGNEDEEIARACLKNGAFDYIVKPVKLDSLSTIVKTRLLLQKQEK
jgi:DNA-binding response OmpR family regulator